MVLCCRQSARNKIQFFFCGDLYSTIVLHDRFAVRGMAPWVQVVSVLNPVRHFVDSLADWAGSHAASIR
jgi:hypothetical protein